MSFTDPLATYHYLDLNRLGRGEVLYLFLKDAGIDVQETRYAYDSTWPATSARLQEQGITKTGKLPALKWKGRLLTQHIPILRHLARELGRYDGDDSMEKYLVDAVADMYIDWRVRWVQNLSDKSDEYKDKFVPAYYDLVGSFYGENTTGPYLLGDKITYVDFAVYQSIDNDMRTGTLPKTLPESLVKLKEAMEARPNIAGYIKETQPEVAEPAK